MTYKNWEDVLKVLWAELYQRNPATSIYIFFRRAVPAGVNHPVTRHPATDYDETNVDRTKCIQVFRAGPPRQLVNGPGSWATMLNSKNGCQQWRFRKI